MSGCSALYNRQHLHLSTTFGCAVRGRSHLARQSQNPVPELYQSRSRPAQRSSGRKGLGWGTVIEVSNTVQQAGICIYLHLPPGTAVRGPTDQPP